MELDELRRQWQQPAPTEAPPLAPAELDALLAQRSGNLVEKMQRNARLEMAYNVLVGLALPVVYLKVQNPLFKSEVVLLLVLVAVLVGYYYRKLKMLGQMVRAETNVRENLGRLCSGLREMLRFYYRLSLWAGPWALFLVYGYYVGRALANGELFTTKLLSLGAGMLVGGSLSQIAVVYGTRWYLQRLYGRHLDRLEANLRDLNDETTA